MLHSRPREIYGFERTGPRISAAAEREGILGHRTQLSFVIGGAQKSGTTTLDEIFRRHSELQMATVKETHFFDDESRDWKDTDLSLIETYFADADGRLRGESTPITMYWRPAVRRLHRYNPGIRIVLLLRDPVTRAFSHWMHECSHGREKLSFTEAIRSGARRLRDQPMVEGLPRLFAYVERGMYGEQLRYLSDYFPKEQIHCEIFEEFFQGRAAGLERIAQFLEIGPFPAGLPEVRLNPSVPRASQGMAREDVESLSALFRDEVKGVEDFLERGIPNWHREPEKPAEG